MQTNNNTFHVTGVIKDLPDNVHLTFDGLLSLTTQTSGQPPLNKDEDWFWWNCQRENVNLAAVILIHPRRFSVCYLSAPEDKGGRGDFKRPCNAQSNNKYLEMVLVIIGILIYQSQAMKLMKNI